MVRLELDEAQSPPVQPAASATRAWTRRRERLAWTAALLATLTAAVVLTRTFRSTPSPSELRLDVATPPTTDPISVALSPDGRRLVFSAASDGRARLWLRDLASGVVRFLPGTDDATMPFWSPDGGSVGFFVPDKLKRIDVTSGSVQELANALGGRGGTWGTEGVILFAPSATSPIMRIAETGVGVPVAVTDVEPQLGPRFPVFLPGSRHFLYFIPGPDETRGVYIGHVDRSPSTRLTDADSFAVYEPSGHLLFVRQRTLLRQPFDPASLTLSGKATPLIKDIMMSEDVTGFTALSVSAAGPVVIRTGPSGSQTRLAWFDRSGKELAPVADDVNSPALSPDGQRVAFQRGTSDDIMILDRRGIATKVVSSAAFDIYPVWAPDGTEILFTSNRSGPDRVGPYQVYRKRLDGIGSEDLLVPPQTSTHPIRFATDWSSNGRFVLMGEVNFKTTGLDLMYADLNGDRKPHPLVQTKANERDAQFSPNAEWFAYQSDDSGTSEVYVEPFLRPGERTQVSRNGGRHVRWARDGSELYYWADDGYLMSVSIRLGLRGKLEPGAPARLFSARIGRTEGGGRQQYDVSRDGRFLMSVLTEVEASPFSLIFDWSAPQPR